jgi:arginase
VDIGPVYQMGAPTRPARPGSVGGMQPTGVGGSGVGVIVVPYHQDDQLAPGTIPVPPGATELGPELPPGDRWERITALHRAVADAVAAGGTTVLSGDCLVLLGTLAGVQRSGLDPALIWFDAHGDVHTTATSTSGYLGGMALRMALGGDPDRLAGPLGIRPLAEDAAVLVDARDLDPAEREWLDASAVRRIPVAEVGPDLLGDRPLIVHVDLDVVDAAELPGLIFPVPGGPSAADVVGAVHRLRGTGRTVALDLACTWHPTADPAVAAARADLLAALLA